MFIKKLFSIKNIFLKNIFSHKFKLLLMFGLCSFLTPFIGSSINLAIPKIGHDFDMNIVSLGWIATIYLLSTAVFLVPLGRLADIVGRKKIFLFGIIIFTIASILCAISTSGIFILSARALQGLGSAMIFGTSMALLVSMFPPKERGKALGINATGVYTGSSMGPVLGGFITQYFGWRYIFVFATIIAAIVSIMAFKLLTHEDGQSKGEKFDLKGSILYGISVIAMLYGTTLLPAISGYAVIFAGITTFVIFCIIEDKTKHPVFHIDLLLKNKKFAMSNLAALLNFSAAFGIPFLLSMYLQYIRGFQPNQAGLILLISAITMVFGSPLSGRLSDKKDPRILASLGMTIASFGLLTISFILSPTTPIYLIAIGMFIFGFGMSLFATPNTHAAMESVTPRHLGLASSIFATMRMFGQTVSMGITMLVLSLMVGKVSGSSAVAPKLMHATQVTLFIFGLICVACVFVSFARGARCDIPEEKV